MRKPRNWTYITVKTIVTAFMLGAAAISFSHIVDVAHTLGLTWEAWTVPFAIDGLAVLGLIGRSARFAHSTQRAGLKLMCGAGVLSLVCNVAAGDNRGQQLYGVLVVAGFMTAEWYSAKLIAAPARVVARCQPGCTCGKHTRKAARPKPAPAPQPVVAVPPQPVHVVTPVRTRRPRTVTLGVAKPISPLTGNLLVAA